LYFSPDRGTMDGKNPKVIELSKTLKALPLFIDRPDKDKFRNPNGVSYKLANLASLDPNFKGKGATGRSNLDKIVFNEYFNKRDELRTITIEIKKITKDEELKYKLTTIEDDNQSFDDSVIAGQMLYKLHKLRERNPKTVKRKKEQTFSLYGKLSCEICAFAFETFYGTIGTGFIECHHLTRLSNFKVSTATTLDSLALVCSNCHIMLHRKIDTVTVQDLKMMIKYDRF